MNLLVTGGFGFIGSHFVTEALSSGHNVTVIDKFTYAANEENITKDLLSRIQIHKFDLANLESCKNFFKGQDIFDWVVNFAAESHVDRSINDSIPFVESNVKGVVNLLEFCRKGNIGKMLQMSTDEVYGTIESGEWTEASTINPRSPYSASKASAELFCNSYRITHGVKATILRCANNFGPNQSVDKFIPKVISSLMENVPITVYGNGRNIREWIYVKNTVSLLLAVVENSKIPHNIFNIGGTEMVNLDLVTMIGMAMNLEPKINFVQDRKGHDFRYSVNDSLIKSLIEPKFKNDLYEELKLTIEWYLANGNWIKKSRKLLSK